MKLTDAELFELNLSTPDPMALTVDQLRALLDEVTEWRDAHDDTVAKLAKADALHAAAVDLMGLLDSGYLVRNTDDAKPGFAMRQIEPMMKLKAMQAAIEGWVAK